MKRLILAFVSLFGLSACYDNPHTYGIIDDESADDKLAAFRGASTSDRLLEGLWRSTSSNDEHSLNLRLKPQRQLLLAYESPAVAGCWLRVTSSDFQTKTKARSACVSNVPEASCLSLTLKPTLIETVDAQVSKACEEALEETWKKATLTVALVHEPKGCLWLREKCLKLNK